jgi:MFS transporter, FHS family, glucose/mannose:H+ symporter
MGPEERRMDGRRSVGKNLAVLHPAFALTGICHSISGPLLPSLARTFHLDDSRAGLLLFAYFAGTSLGAVLCGSKHKRTLFAGFLAIAITGVAVAFTNRTFLYPAFLLFGMSVGAPMTAVSMYTGCLFGARSAAPLTLLNFSWSAGALLAPLLAARLLAHSTFRSAYLILGGAALLAAAACRLWLGKEQEAAPAVPVTSRMLNLRLIALFALLTFLEVGVENSSASWLTTYVQRTAGTGAAWAAAATSFYWGGFLASRGLSSLLLLRVDATRVLRLAVCGGIATAGLLLGFSGNLVHALAMTILGAALAPLFPLLMARFFAQARNLSDSRWVLALCGFGGSVLPWLAGLLSAHTGSLRVGLSVIPVALLAMFCTLSLIQRDSADAVAK